MRIATAGAQTDGRATCEVTLDLIERRLVALADVETEEAAREREFLIDLRKRKFGV